MLQFATDRWSMKQQTRVITCFCPLRISPKHLRYSSKIFSRLGISAEYRWKHFMKNISILGRDKSVAIISLLHLLMRPLTSRLMLMLWTATRLIIHELHYGLICFRVNPIFTETPDEGKQLHHQQHQAPAKKQHFYGVPESYSSGYWSFNDGKLYFSYLTSHLSSFNVLNFAAMIKFQIMLGTVVEIVH